MVMEKKKPEWVDERFLTAALAGGETNSPNVTVLEFTCTQMELPIKNFTSYLYKVEVKYRDEKQHEQIEKLIVKDPIVDGLLDEACNREPIVYYKVLQKMFEKTGYYFGPKAFYCCRENVLIMQNLKEDGYILTENAKQLDFSHSVKVFEAIAKFHAASIACHHDDPKIYDLVGLEVLYADRGLMEPWTINSVKAMIVTAEEIGDKRFADLLRSKLDGIWEVAKNKYKANPAKMNVFNHGDLHKKNILFKYKESGEVADVKMVDYQNCRYGSPVLDLLYFMWTSADEDVRESRQQELYSIYLKTFNKSLEELGCGEILTREMLEEDLLWAFDWALVNFCLAFPLVVAEADFEGILDLKIEDFETMKFRKLFHGKIFRPLVKSMFRQMVDFFLSGKKMVA